MTDVVIVLTTVPDGDLGDRIARALVEERLAACVNVHEPMTSVYKWEGRVEQERERQVVIKTTVDRIALVQARVAELHSYDLPEFLVLPVSDGSMGYLAWVAESAR